MPKLIITRDGVSLRDYPLDKPRTTIGRKPDSDIFLDDQTVSSEHAAVSLMGAVAVTDLGSTNGTFVNNARIGKHDLQHGDVIRIGQHELKFIDEQTQDLTRTMVFNTPPTQAQAARLHVISGARAGSVLEVTQDRTTLGKAGGQVAVVVRETSGFRLLPVAGEAPVQVNQRPVAAQGVALCGGEEIEIAGSRLRFEVL